MIWSSWGKRLVALPGVSAFTSFVGLGTAAFKNTGTSGNTVPLLDGANTFSAAQIISVAAAGTVFSVRSVEDGAGSGPDIAVRRISASPAANDGLGTFAFQGNDSAGNNTNYGQLAAAITDPTDGSESGIFGINTRRVNVFAQRMTVGAGVYHTSATGGDKGNNTINFGAVYDDNTLLTCYPFDAYLDGKIDFEKWDAKVPDRPIPAIMDDEGKVIEPEGTERRQHDDMRKFAARLGTEHDPLDIDKYEAHWREKRHLSSLPNEEKFDPVKGLPAGAWIQRLVETVEIQAIHISQLNARLKAIETAKAPKTAGVV